MVTEERLEQLERSLQQAGSALQAANCRISFLETAAGTTTSVASMVDIRVLGKPSIFAGDEGTKRLYIHLLLDYEKTGLLCRRVVSIPTGLHVDLTGCDVGNGTPLFFLRCMSSLSSVVVAGTGWILGFIRRPQASLAAQRAATGENGCHANIPTHQSTLIGPLRCCNIGFVFQCKFVIQKLTKIFDIDRPHLVSLMMDWGVCSN